LDSLQQYNPVVAFHLAHAVGDFAHAFQRTVQMVRTKHLDLTFLRNFTVWIGARRTTMQEAIEAIGVLLPLVRSSVSNAADVAIEFLAFQYEGLGERNPVAEVNAEFDTLAWDVVEATVKDTQTQSYWWARIAERLSIGIEATRVAKLLVEVMLGNNYSLRDDAEGILSSLATKQPSAVMEFLGEAMLDDDRNWMFNAGRFRVFTSVPQDTLTRWLDVKGVKGALRLARHVPAPFLDDKNQPRLHPLTEYLLTAFENEDRVFREFAAGVHSSQSYMGDMSEHKEKEAELARKFRDHPIRRVREWAELEIASASREAEIFRGIRDKMRD
jgi:hypothetical protein